VNYERRDGAENRGADYYRREPELQLQDVEGEQVKRDHVDLEVCVNDVRHPQDHDCADDEFRVLGKCGHRGRSSCGGDEKSLATEIAVVNAVRRSANDAPAARGVG
jgi:hypothetical protein